MYSLFVSRSPGYFSFSTDDKKRSLHRQSIDESDDDDDGVFCFSLLTTSTSRFD